MHSYKQTSRRQDAYVCKAALKLNVLFTMVLIVAITVDLGDCHEIKVAAAILESVATSGCHSNHFWEWLKYHPIIQN